MSTDFLVLLSLNTCVIIIVVYLMVSSSTKKQLDASEKNNQSLKKSLEPILKAIYEDQKNLNSSLEQFKEEIQTEFEIRISGLSKQINPRFDSIDRANNELNKNQKELQQSNSSNKEEIINNINEFKKELNEKLDAQTRILKDLTSDFEGL